MDGRFVHVCVEWHVDCTYCVVLNSRDSIRVRCDWTKESPQIYGTVAVEPEEPHRILEI